MSLFFHRSTVTKSKPGLNTDHAVKISSTSPSTQPDTVPRIPYALQNIFLKSNRGEDVHVPPPKLASRIFRRLTFRGRNRKPNGPISTATLDHTTNTTGSTSSSDDDPTYILPVNASRTSTSYSSSTSSSNSNDILDDRNNNKMTLPLKQQVTLTITPLLYVDAILQSRGYPTMKYNALQTSYYNSPTTYQQVCYDTYLLKLVKQHPTEPDDRRRSLQDLTQLLLAGISSNPCNAHGESLLHTVCRLGHHGRPPPSADSWPRCTGTAPLKSWSYELLQLMISVGKVDVSNCVDDYGRTPLHDACWCHSICYDTIALLLQQDPTLILLQDCRGATPLSYIPSQHHTTFVEFIASRKDEFFPDIHRSGPQQRLSPLFPSQLVQEPPHSRPVPDPTNALTPDVARMVVSGRITPQELSILLLQEGDDDDDDDDDESESSYDDDDDEDDDELLADEGDDSSTILSTENDNMSSPRNMDTRDMALHISAISDDDEGSNDDDESYSDLDEMLKRLKSPTATALENDCEAVLGIGRPQYGYDMMVANNHRSEKKEHQNINYDSNADLDNEIYVESRMNDYVKPMSSVAIPKTIHCSTIDDTQRSSVVAAATTSLNRPDRSGSTGIMLENHPIRDTTIELLEFSV